jgi:DNA-binding Xre family transcriptional regulator
MSTGDNRTPIDSNFITCYGNARQQFKEVAVGKIVSKVRQLRLDYAQRIGRPVEQKEVADAVGVTEATLSRIERGIISRIDFETLVKLCGFYGKALEKFVDVGDLLGYDPNNKPVLEAA